MQVQVDACLVMISLASQHAVVCTSVGTYMYVSYLSAHFRVDFCCCIINCLQKCTALLKRRLEVEGNNIWTWLATCWSLSFCLHLITCLSLSTLSVELNGITNDLNSSSHWSMNKYVIIYCMHFLQWQKKIIFLLNDYWF